MKIQKAHFLKGMQIYNSLLDGNEVEYSFITWAVQDPMDYRWIICHVSGFLDNVVL